MWADAVYCDLWMSGVSYWAMNYSMRLDHQLPQTQHNDQTINPCANNNTQTEWKARHLEWYQQLMVDGLVMMAVMLVPPMIITHDEAHWMMVSCHSVCH